MTNFNTKSLREELAQALSRTFDDSKGIAVYGAGDTAEKWFVPFLEGEITPAYFIDDTPGKRGSSLYGVPIISLEEAHTLCKSCVILLGSIVPGTRDIMADTLRKDPIEGAVICPRWQEYVFCKQSEKVLSVFDMLEDDLSKAIYANMIQARMGLAGQDFSLVRQGSQYFGIPAFMKVNYNEVFVDCGAYVGDTLEQFLNVKWGQVERMYAFEPMERQFRAMRFRVDRLKREWALTDDQIVLVQAGVGERSYQSELKQYEKGAVPVTGEALSGESAHGDIPVISIDDYFSKQPITFLKADIEGYEWKMLHGAERTIKRDRPKLAVCVYHTPFDMYRIALKIKSICPDYKFDIRQHYYGDLETVLYAYI